MLVCTHPSKDKDSFIGQQEFVVRYSKAPKQPQSSTRPICHSHTMMSMGANQPPYALLHIGAHRATHCATGDHASVGSLMIDRRERKK